MSHFDDITFADNPDPRRPVVLVLDTSESMGQMSGEGVAPIAAVLNSGLETLVTELHADRLARRRAEIAIVTFGASVEVAADFATVDNLVLPTLTPAGVTPLGAALELALDMVEERKRTYRANGVAYYRPWILLLTDGLPTDDWSAAADRLKAAEASKAVAFFPVGIDGANLDVLNALGARAALKLKGMAFRELFVWLSASQTRVSASNPGDSVPLPAPSSWAEV